MADDIQQDQNVQEPDVTLEKLQADLDSAMSGWKRTAADFENYRRRKEAENQELVSFAREVAVAKLLPTLDSLEQALKHMPAYHYSDVVAPFMGPSEGPDKSGNYSKGEDFADKYQSWQKGVNGLIVQLDKALGELGVKKIEAIGKKFDPNFHEAVREVEGEEDGMVTDELQTGFELNGKVIRPSQVVISKKSNVVGSR